MSRFTHVCIMKGVHSAFFSTDKIAVGDFVTLMDTKNQDEIHKPPPGYIMQQGMYLRFEECPAMWYHESQFKRLPPPEIVYVAVSEEVTESLPQLVEN